ncbi:MAG: replication-associated recombination protein A [Deltaproteobacteria bacterium]|nr:replication-associated recombination protein A [Deltaproteobacteria bacterium]
MFSEQEQKLARSRAPLADRLRPRDLAGFVGQPGLLGPGKPLRRLHDEGRASSLILWGPPGTGKTTLARILAGSWQSEFVEFSAVLSGVAEVRRTVEEARRRLARGGGGTVLFVDEIHRFNKAQQDAFLPHVESGLITLLGATTENPSFEVIPALLSRLRVLVLEPLRQEDLETILDRALTDREQGLGDWGVELAPEARRHLVASSFGDARRLLTSLEVAAEAAPLGEAGKRVLDLALVEGSVGRRMLRYDKAGEEHYNLISALHKSLRGSDPDAALYWLARMLEAGEDAHYILRRLTVFACEDVGLADPYALNQLVAARQGFDLVGLPDGDLMLAQAVVYLALAPKANSVYAAFKEAKKDAKELGPLEVPLTIRNAPTGLMRELGYGTDYQYPHDFPEALVAQDYLPERLRERQYYRPTGRGREKYLAERLARIKEYKARLRQGKPNESS